MSSAFNLQVKRLKPMDALGLVVLGKSKFMFGEEFICFDNDYLRAYIRNNPPPILPSHRSMGVLLGASRTDGGIYDANKDSMQGS